MSQRNQRRIDKTAKSAQVRSGQMNMSQPTSLPPMPGPRSYSTGLAQWITQVRLEEQLAGEHPYSYAFNNPTTYVDPDGLSPLGPCEQAARWTPSVQGDSKATAFRRCQSFLESQFDTRGRMGMAQFCPGGRREICLACSKASGLPIDCSSQPSCPGGSGTGNSGIDFLGIVGTVISGMGEGAGLFDHNGCMQLCREANIKGVPVVNKKILEKACTAACNALINGKCPQLFARCTQMGDTVQGDACMLFYLSICKEQ